VLREEIIEDGAFSGHQPRAEIFHTAYVVDDAEPARRPVTFAFNGGPGLLLGLAAPGAVRAATGGDG